jgi:hypothetical protein
MVHSFHVYSSLKCFLLVHYRSSKLCLPCFPISPQQNKCFLPPTPTGQWPARPSALLQNVARVQRISAPCCQDTPAQVCHTAACRVLTAVLSRSKSRAASKSSPIGRNVRCLRLQDTGIARIGLQGSFKMTNRFAYFDTVSIKCSAGSQLMQAALPYTQLQPGSGTLGIDSLKMFAILGLIPGLGVFPTPKLAPSTVGMVGGNHFSVQCGRFFDPAVLQFFFGKTSVNVGIMGRGLLSSGDSRGIGPHHPTQAKFHTAVCRWEMDGICTRHLRPCVSKSRPPLLQQHAHGFLLAGNC